MADPVAQDETVLAYDDHATGTVFCLVDAEGADVIVQAGLFGEIVYG